MKIGALAYPESSAGASEEVSSAITAGTSEEESSVVSLGASEDVFFAASEGAVYPKMDLVSFGPTLRSPHTPDERCNIPSVEKFWTFLKALLKEI